MTNIVITGESHPLVVLAAAELRRFLGLVSANADNAPDFVLESGLSHLHPQGYVVSTNDATVTIAAAQPIGVLYGVYGYLEALGFGFFLGGDTLPDANTFRWNPVNTSAQPVFDIRGSLIWPNFLNSPATWDLPDYQVFFDQMVKMKNNLVHIPAYGTPLKPTRPMAPLLISSTPPAAFTMPTRPPGAAAPPSPPLSLTVGAPPPAGGANRPVSDVKSLASAPVTGSIQTFSVPGPRSKARPARSRLSAARRPSLAHSITPTNAACKSCSAWKWKAIPSIPTSRPPSTAASTTFSMPIPLSITSPSGRPKCGRGSGRSPVKSTIGCDPLSSSENTIASHPTSITWAVPILSPKAYG